MTKASGGMTSGGSGGLRERRPHRAPSYGPKAEALECSNLPTCQPANLATLTRGGFGELASPACKAKAQALVKPDCAGVVDVHVQTYGVEAFVRERLQRCNHQPRAHTAPAPGRVAADL